MTALAFRYPAPEHLPPVSNTNPGAGTIESRVAPRLRIHGHRSECAVGGRAGLRGPAWTVQVPLYYDGNSTLNFSGVLVAGQLTPPVKQARCFAPASRTTFHQDSD